MVSDVVEAGQLLAELVSEVSSSGLTGDQAEGKELLMLRVTGPPHQETKHVCSVWVRDSYIMRLDTAPWTPEQLYLITTALQVGLISTLLLPHTTAQGGLISTFNLSRRLQHTHECMGKTKSSINFGTGLRSCRSE